MGWQYRLAGTLLISLSAGAAAQAPVAPELLRLERYLGSWTYEGEDKTPGTGGFSGAGASTYRATSMGGNSVTWIGTGASSGNRVTDW